MSFGFSKVCVCSRKIKNDGGRQCKKKFKTVKGGSLEQWPGSTFHRAVTPAYTKW